jgi:hypothetical protein
VGAPEIQGNPDNSGGMFRIIEDAGPCDGFVAMVKQIGGEVQGIVKCRQMTECARVWGLNSYSIAARLKAKCRVAE